MEKSAIITYRFVTDSRPNAQGRVKIYVRFYENGIKIKDWNTDIYWPRDLFDADKIELLPRSEEDQEAEMNNLKLKHLKGKLFKSETDAFLNNKRNTLADYLNILEGYYSTDDFVYFAHKHNNHEYNEKIIKYPTWRRHRASINRIIQFFKKDFIPFNEITLLRIQEFNAYYKNQGLTRNTIAGYHKDMKKYIKAAVEAKLMAENPYDKFKFSYIEGNRECLEQEEVKALVALYLSDKLDSTLKEVLRRFLFSCFTGLRISDSHVVKREMIKNNVLVFKPLKGSTGKIIRLPLPQIALKLIEGKTGLLFEKMSEGHINHMLKIIAVHASINKVLKFHCARDTYGTIFIELGGDVKSLKDLMGHFSIRTTEIYLKMSSKRKHMLQNNFDTMFA